MDLYDFVEEVTRGLTPLDPEQVMMVIMMMFMTLSLSRSEEKTLSSLTPSSPSRGPTVSTKSRISTVLRQKGGVS